MAADDFLNTPSDQGFPSETEADSPYAGNRPASGARRATPGEVLTQGFQGAENAGDFLGLDVEFAGSQDPNAGFGGNLDLVPPPGTYDPSQVVEPAPLPDSDPVQDFAQAPSAFEFGEDLGSEEGEALEATTSSRTPMLVAALAVAALTAGGVFYGPKLYKSLTSGSDIPRTASTPRTPPTPRRGDPTPAPAPTDTPLVAADPLTDPLTDPMVPVETPVVEPETTFDPVVPLLAGGPTTPAGDPTASPIDPLLVATGGPVAPAGDTAFPDLGGAAFDWAGSDTLELIWRGSEVPLEAVRAPAKTLMPRIGQVRVFTTTGDVFDGRLYAVGENRVWIDAAPGRIGIDGEQVERIEVLPPSTGVQGEVELAGGKRVRATVAGGQLYGRVLKMDGENVTLALDDGGRVRVKASDLEDLGTGRVVVVGR